MKQGYTSSIPQRLWLVIVSTTAIVLLVFGAIMLAMSALRTRTALERQLLKSAELVSHHVAAALSFRDRQTARQQLASLSNDPNITGAVLLDEDGEPFATFGSPANEAPAMSSGSPATRWRSGMVQVTHPVRVRGDLLGELHFSYDTASYRGDLIRQMASVIVGFAGAVALAFILSHYLQGIISRPLLDLAEVAHRVAIENRYDLRAACRGNDEIALVIIRFNQMLEQIESRDRELRQYHKQLRSLATEVTSAEERERRQLAIGLHDSVCQLLAVARMRITSLPDDSNLQRCRDALQALDELVEEALAETRALTFQLSPPVLYDLGLAPAVGALAHQLKSQTGLSVTVAPETNAGDLPQELQIVLYRIVRELLINVVKHANAETATVSFERENGNVRTIVEDDGRGINQTAPTRGSQGFGLFSIRERVQHMNGRLDIDTGNDKGTRIAVTLPCPHQPTPRS